MDKQRLKGLIIRYDGKQSVLAKAIGMSLSRLNAKINETNAEFSKSEMLFIKERYHLSDDEFNAIFFTTLVS